ncbi:SMP-30/gluconolactonase/LRE family protein [Ramlibacter sp. PS4R-6]|uniref:SMP-30/gluconolactonase/LRE family protein n=1 Tax=Ramlibacter sp. PS4R-6 TaxID=3133438 RepID=UPI003095A580
MRWLAALLLACAACAHAQDADPQAALKAQLARIQELRQARPGDGLLAYFQAFTHAGLGQKDEAIAQLRSLKGRRLGIVPARQMFEPLWADASFQAVVRELADEEPRTADAPVVLRLADAQLVPEGIAYDARRRVHYIGSIAQRKIVAVDAQGRARDFATGLDRVLGLAIDAKGDWLCAVSTNGFEDGASKERRNAVVCFALASGRRLARIDVPDAMQLNDLALAPDGSWYVTDSAAGRLYRIAPGASSAQRVGETGLPGANGVAVSPGGIVYVALNTGIARIDPATGAAARMAQPDDVVTGGIDGLYWHEGALVGVQNVSNPGRVVRVELDGAAQKVTGVRVLQASRHPEFAEPTTGTIVGGALHVIANSHVAHFQPDATLRDPGRLRPTAIVAVPLVSQ